MKLGFNALVTSLLLSLHIDSGHQQRAAVIDVVDAAGNHVGNGECFRPTGEHVDNHQTIVIPSRLRQLDVVHLEPLERKQEVKKEDMADRHFGILDSREVTSGPERNPPAMTGYRRFNLLGSQDKTLEYTQGDGLAVEYKHLTLKEQRAGGGKGSKGVHNDGLLSVIEELHVITLKTQFNHDGESLTIEVTTLPFVVISNLTQFVRAWASVLWFNLLSPNPEDVSFFFNPPDAPWFLIADALSWQFSCCTNRGLNTDQLQMLGKKLCGDLIITCAAEAIRQLQLLASHGDY
ncbi:unnamed protein product [Ranitomeya imitator]|uniref:Secreted protein n=1 Tax=Ranitomeya imitator TaxID=111125 RepID=A0ABN9LLQ0_9NEOB|nr:unnamed protein product [Ranitomeya imitator]